MRPPIAALLTLLLAAVPPAGQRPGTVQDPAIEVVLLPQELKSGTLIWPYTSAKQ